MAALFLGAASLICFGACERHKASELSYEEHAPADAEHPTPAPSATPAQFFPSPTP